MKTDNESLFDLARDLAEKYSEKSTRVGTISEKLLHKTLKFYIESNPECHEIPICGCIADIVNESGIKEVQTRSFEKLLPKLCKFLPENNVEIIHPLTAVRYISYLDEDSGELIIRKKSPKHDGVNRAACELYKIKDFLTSQNLTVRLVFLEFEDFRIKQDKKRRLKNSESLMRRVPIGIKREIVLKTREDYKVFLPDEISEEFTASELSKLIRLDSRRTHNTLTLLLSLGIIERSGIRGKAYLYKKRSASPAF